MFELDFLFECNVLWSDDHNDIDFVVSLWGQLSVSINLFMIIFVSL
jgi:hypothetical protein